MTQLTENVFAVEVPEGASNFEICNYGLNDALEYDYPQGHEVSDLPPGNWQLLCTTREASELQAACIVDSDGNGWKDYDKTSITSCYPFTSSCASLRSLLTSKGLDVNKNYVLLKKEVIC